MVPAVRAGRRIIAIISDCPAYVGEGPRGLPIRMEAGRVSVATLHNRRRRFGIVAPPVLLADGACATAAPPPESIPAATATENASSFSLALLTMTKGGPHATVSSFGEHR